MAYLPPLLLVSLGWFLRDPVSLLVAMVLASISLLVSVFQGQYRWLRGRGPVLLFSLFGVYLVSAVVSRESLASSLQGNYQRNFGLIFWLSIFLVFAFATSGKVRIKSFVEQSLVVCVLISIIYGGLQRFDKDPFPWVNPYDAVQLTLGNPNFAGAFLGMIAVVPFAFAVRGGLLWKRLVGLVGFVGVGFLALGTKSLQATVVLVIAVLVYSLIVSLKSGGAVAKAFRYLSGGVGVGFAVLVPMLLFSGASFLSGIREKFFFQGSVTQRLDFWRTGIEIFKDHPWLGVGPDQFQRYAALYRTKEQIIRDGAFTIPDKAHSVPIDALANGGIVTGKQIGRAHV